MKRINLNVGAGGYVIKDFLSLDIYSEHYYKSRDDFLKDRIEYDMSLNQPLPFQSCSVDNIYASHVIEHCDDLMVFRFFEEALRVLKPSGVLRTACPDFRFLFEVMQNPTDWFQHYIKFKFRCHKTFELDTAPTPEDYLIYTAATARCRFYKNKITEQVISPSDIKHLGYNQLLSYLKDGTIYRRDHPGDHVNAWDFNRLHEIARRVGFARVIESKKNASISHVMRSSLFDSNTPETSLYVDYLK